MRAPFAPSRPAARESLPDPGRDSCSQLDAGAGAAQRVRLGGRCPARSTEDRPASRASPDRCGTVALTKTQGKIDELPGRVRQELAKAADAEISAFDQLDILDAARRW